MKPFRKTILKNGLRVITVPQSGLSATVLVLVEAGSKYETKAINGLSHFLEHLCFKGTVQRPTALAISSELDKLGAEYNAFTSQEYTGYYAKVMSRHLEKAIEIVADLYSNPVFNEQEIEKEKGVIIEEINMYEDLPPRRVAELFDELLYGDQPAGWPVGGRKEIIKKLQRADFLKYRQEHYVAKATVVVVVGHFLEEAIFEKIRKNFANVPADRKFGKVSTKDGQRKPQAMLQHKQSDQTHLVLGCRAFSDFDERRFALEVLNDVLGGGMSSRLFQRVREQLGAAYYVRSTDSLYSDHGYWAAAAGVDHQKISVVIRAILEEMKKLTTDLVGDEELQRAKDHLSGQIVLGLETSDEQASFHGVQEVIRKKVFSPEEILKRIKAVRAQEVRQVARDIFQDKNLNLAIIGPFKDKAVFLKDLHL